MTRTLPLGFLLCAVLLGCGPGSPAGRDEVLVFAAASLTDAFADLETAFEAAYPGIDVAVSTGASSSLREQILEGAQRVGHVIHPDQAGPVGLVAVRPEDAQVHEGEAVMLIVVGQKRQHRVPQLDLRVEHGLVPGQHLGKPVGPVDDVGDLCWPHPVHNDTP